MQFLDFLALFLGSLAILSLSAMFVGVLPAVLSKKSNPAVDVFVSDGEPYQGGGKCSTK